VATCEYLEISNEWLRRMELQQEEGVRLPLGAMAMQVARGV